MSFEDEHPADRQSQGGATRHGDPDRTMPRRGFAAVAGGIAAAATAGCFGIGDSGDVGDGADVSEAVEERLGEMNRVQTIGQILQLDLSTMTTNGPNDTGEFRDDFVRAILGEGGLGSVLTGGGSAPVPNTSEGWAEATNRIQEHALGDENPGTPVVYGTDAVHGHNNLPDATIFPHNVGLGATWNPELARNVASHTADALRATGVHWNFDPVCDLARDHRWGRYYECFGEDPLHVSTMAAARVRGLQGEDDVPGADGVAATPKHFVGYSKPRGGLDRNPAQIPWRRLRTQHLAPFQASVDAGAETIMLNSGSVNGIPGHASPELIREILREEMGFDGVVISDWNDAQRLQSIHGVGESLEDAVKLCLDAGVDLFMVGTRTDLYWDAIVALLESGDVTEERIERSARRVLRLKERLGLFDEPTIDPTAASDAIGGGDDLAYDAASQSLTLLEHDEELLPLSGEEDVLVTGPAADDPAMQLGGWTVGWQGVPDGGPTPETVTGLAGLEAAIDGSVEHVPWSLGGGGDLDAAVSAAQDADVAVVFAGEGPYAEGQGDDQRATLAESQVELIQALDGVGIPIVLVTISGRPLGLEAVNHEFDALLAAFLPGAQGGRAIADALVGEVVPAGRLPVTWPRHGGQAPLYHNGLPGDTELDPRYEFGAGKSYTSFSYDLPELERSTVTSPSLEETAGLSVDVANEGSVAADRVVLAMGSQDYAAGPEMLPRQTLVGFDRVHLEPGEQTTVSMDCSIGALGIVGGDVDADGERTVVPGEYEVTAGRWSATMTIE